MGAARSASRRNRAETAIVSESLTDKALRSDPVGHHLAMGLGDGSGISHMFECRLTYSCHLRMETEDQMCRRYEAEFDAIAALDRRYYLNRVASFTKRRDYAARQVKLEEMRSKLYSELASVRQSVKGAK